MTKDEALKRGMELLKSNISAQQWFELQPEITAIKKALAQPEQEPVAYTTGHCENHKQKGGCQLHNLQCGWPDCDRKPITAPQLEQEPVAWMVYTQEGQSVYVTDNPTDLQESQRALPLYTTPPKRTWVALTDEDLEFWTKELGQGELGRGVLRAVADHLKEKNT